MRCAYALEATIKQVGPAQVSAFILRTNHRRVDPRMAPPPDYLPIVRQICDKYNVVYISDEVLCGFGRTGKIFGVDHFGVTPTSWRSAKDFRADMPRLGQSSARENLRRLSPWITAGEA